MRGGIGYTVALLLVLVLASACSTSALEPTPEPEPEQGSPGLVLTIGDISDEPTKKIDRFQPLVDYLVENMKDLGFGSGRVVIAASLEEMIGMVRDGEVDVYFDSPFPALTTQANTETQLILRRWKDGDATYKGVVITAADSEIRTVDDLVGRVVAAEESYSTTGFASQAIDLADAGFRLKIVDGPGSSVPADSVGIWFSRDEENALDAVISGTVHAGFISDQDLVKLSPELFAQVRVLTESHSLPRQLVSIRGDIADVVMERIRTLLVGLEETEEGRVLLDHIKTARFDEISSEDEASLSYLASRLSLLQ